MSLSGTKQKQIRISLGILAWVLLSLAIFVFPADSGISRESDFRQTGMRIRLHDKALELHLATPDRAVTPNLWVLYASGDGGWFGTAIKIFESIARTGYPVAGFSSRSYLNLLGNLKLPVTEKDLESDYLRMAQESRLALGLQEDSKVILAGWSREAAFAVLVGSESDFKSFLAGVIAFGLPNKEELKIHKHGKRIIIANLRSKEQTLIFETYDRIPEIAPAPVALIQSSRDGYPRAEAARSLFGEDTSVRRFFDIPAKNHGFRGGWDAFVGSLRQSLNWVTAMNTPCGTNRASAIK